MAINQTIIFPDVLGLKTTPLNLNEVAAISLAELNAETNIFAKLFGFGKYQQKITTVAEDSHLKGFNNDIINQGVNSLFQDKIYSPDAIPDGKGGFKPSNSNYWNPRYSSVLTGQPVMCPVTFVGTSYTSLSGQIITIPTITFELCMISMKKRRIIEKTDIAGNDSGSVKEYISSKDWEIEIRAVIMASQNVSEGMQNFYQEGKYPEENMEIIDLLLNAPVAIQVICPYINKRVNASNPTGNGKTYLVMDDEVSINQIDGEYEAQRITFPFLTDNPLIIQVAQ